MVAERRAWLPVAAGVSAARGALERISPVVTRYQRGQLPSPVGDPVPADAGVLAARVAARTAGTGSSPAAVVAVLADLAGIRNLDAHQRAAVLRVLASLPELTATGRHTGPHDRPGIGFRITDATTTVVVTVDAASGRLLLHEAVDTAGRRQTSWLPGAAGCCCRPPTDLDGAARCWPMRCAPLFIDPARGA
ncbi:hypothetical protein ACQP2P_16445 [Dactylosporangium sp. CA-139114]|uniref:hypothetical protein n=1 Tax=Dactylosporangium sp. CA-139114 TaxID=3239931 RepID=UPI003D9913C2